MVEQRNGGPCGGKTGKTDAVGVGYGSDRGEANGETTGGCD